MKGITMTEPDKRRKRKRRQTKDRVLQARIPEQLDDELRGRAESLGLSVSTIVRNVLLHTFNLVEGVVSDSAHLARVAQGRDISPPPEAGSQAGESVVIGWQEAVLNLNGVCEQCNTILARGETAAVGVPTRARPVLLCQACFSNLSGEKP